MIKKTGFEHIQLISAGLISTLTYAYLAAHSQYYGDASLTQMLAVTFINSALCFAVWFHYWRNQNTFPVIGMLAFALVFRLIALNGFPLLEDDIYRYLWDGRLAIELGSPYGHIPADFFIDDNLDQRFETILGLINHPDIATIYGPVCQWLFAAAYLIAPGEIWPLQLIFATADMTLVLILLKLAKPLYVMLYAWCPLVITQFAFTAHPDVLGALLLIAGYLAYLHKRFFWVGVLLALATGVKVFALMLAPILLGFKWRGWIMYAATAIVIAAPWGLSEAWLPAGLKQMGDYWLFNAPVYLLLFETVSMQTVKFSLLAILALGCASYYFYTIRHWQLMRIRGDLLYAALFICVPAFNAWYLVWLLPFAVIYPSLWAWTASVSVLLAYASGINLDNSALTSYQIPLWIVLFEFGVIILAAALQPWLIRLVQSYPHSPNQY